MIENTGGGASGFADLALAPELRHALSRLGYEEPTPIQRAAIPPLLEGRDLVGQAATGTGKTAAFALPVLQRILREGGRVGPRALVLVPTRELAVQVSEAMHRYGLDMGFAEDIEAILGNTPENRQTALFSATMPPRIDGMVHRHLRDPERAELGRQASAPADGLLVQQSAYVVPRGHKPAALGRVLDLEAPTAAIVFCRTRDEVDRLTETLNGRGYRAEALHGGMDQ